ncbi:MAG: enoyl-CoA hydratase/isomerase family protein [Candidatus Binataceae bacterium]
MASNFLIERDGPVTTLTFNRPERRNCLDEATILEFEHHLQNIRDDRECRALIVTGAGTSFCAGMDTSAVKEIADPAERRRKLAQLGRRMPRLIGRAFDVLANLDQFTVGAINGHAIGGGWSFALGFDFCVAVEGAEFWVPEVELGMPFRGAPADAIAARMGPWRAKEAILMCRHYHASELLAMGMLNRVVAPDKLMATAREVATTMASMPADAIATSKRGINAVFFGPRNF